MADATEAKRLLIYADSLIFSGAEAFLVDLVKDLRGTCGFELEAAVPFSNQRLFLELGEAIGKAPVHDVPAQPLRLAALHLPGMAGSIRRSLEGCDADLVLLNLPSPEYGSGLLLSGALPETPKVGLLHIAVSMKEMGFRAGWVRDWIARRALKNLDAVCALSSRAETFFRVQLGSRRATSTVIRMPKPSPERRPQSEARSALGLPEGVPLVGMAGRLTFKQKGQDSFVAAAASLAERHQDLCFVVAGDGPDLAKLSRMIRRSGLGDRFHLLGHVEDIGLFLSAIDVIAIPSRFEGLPLIALEALQVGVPGVATAVDGLLDVWPPEWTVPPSEPDRLALGIEVILQQRSSRIAELIKEGRVLAQQRETVHPGADVAAVLDRFAKGPTEG